MCSAHGRENKHIQGIGNETGRTESQVMTNLIHNCFILQYVWVHRVLVGKPEGKRPLGRPRRRWEDNIKMDLQEVEGGRGDWMELAQDRDGWRSLVGTVRNFRVP